MESHGFQRLFFLGKFCEDRILCFFPKLLCKIIIKNYMCLFEKIKQHIYFFFFLRKAYTHTHTNCQLDINIIVLFFFSVLGFPSSYNNCATLDKSLKFCLTILVCKMRSIRVPTLEDWCDDWMKELSRTHNKHYACGGHGNPLQYSCLENPPGQMSLAGYSPWGHKESDTTEGLNTA